MTSATSRPGWWMASDGQWYPPELHPSYASRFVGTVSGGPVPTAVRTAPQFVGARPVQGATPRPIGHPSPAHRSAWRATIALLVMGLVADILLLVTGGAASPWASSWDPRVLGIVQFVEAHTGLRFEHPVKFEFLGDAAFNKVVTQPSSGPTGAALNQTLGAWRALGLVTGTVNLGSSLNTLESADVVGQYQEDTKTVYVRGATLTPYVRVTLSHELTHALQDQYFDLTKLDNLPADVDSSAVTALVEGDAVRIQNLYQAALSPRDQQLYQQESNALDATANQASGVPAILSDLFSLPYAFGPTYVDSLYAAGGNAAIDAAFRSPPTTQAQIVDPAAYPTNWTPAHVEPPARPAGAHRLEPDSPFGQISLFQVLGSRLGYDVAWDAVQGWQGDNSSIYGQGGHTCVAVAVQMASSAQLADLARASEEWATALPGANVTTAGTLLTLRSCDPGPAGPALPAITPSAFDVLSARAQIIDGAITSGQIDFATAQCAADHFLSALGSSRYSELVDPNPSASEESSLQQLAQHSAQGCSTTRVG